MEYCFAFWVHELKYTFNCACVLHLKEMIFQINARQLDKNSFWVKAKEEMLESEDIFSGLIENFSTKMGRYINIIAKISMS